MGNTKRKLELLAPAANAEIAIEAIKHGADAVYIGAESHGARKSASNSIDDIARVVEFAHRFRAKVYVTVNTIIYEHELNQVENLCRRLYNVGVDALIVQDMALLRLDIPPIPLHASTQCDIRTPEKACFLQEVGMSQLVLARELTLPEIRKITESVDIPVECFVHGALCVSYSGRCHASAATAGRSANRGECAQLCRLPYTLSDGNGRVLARDRHLLSLRDFNASAKLPDLIDAGVSSFKIEGRLKEADYVKNIVAYYSRLLNDYIDSHSDDFERSSKGKSEIIFTPSPEKSFNRGFTDYFLSTRRPDSIASLNTPKSMGESIKDVRQLHNGDGISYFDSTGIYCGVNVNRIEGSRIITPKGPLSLPKGSEIRRTRDIEWQKLMARETAVRTLWLDITISPDNVTAKDERGVEVSLPLNVTKDQARKPMDFRQEFEKLGGTSYRLRNFSSILPETVFIPRSELSALRRQLVNLLDETNKATYPLELRRRENTAYPYYLNKLDFRDNVANSLARRFYEEHGVRNIEEAMETKKTAPVKGTVIMTTRHCVLRELGFCKRLAGRNIPGPLTLQSGNRSFRLHFNCVDCEMEVLV